MSDNTRSATDNYEAFGKSIFVNIFFFGKIGIFEESIFSVNKGLISS